MNSRTVHAVYGPVAAGKSSYARTLANEVNAVRFAIDEWMHALYGPDRPDKVDMAWALQRVGRCKGMIWSTCERILASGRDVVVEIGLMREAERRAFETIVGESGHACAFHFIDAPHAVRSMRVRRRNLEKGNTYSFEVTPGMFDAIESLFEPPTQRESSHTRVVTSDTADA